MADVMSPESRSRFMSRVKTQGTLPERCVRSVIHRLGYRFRLGGAGLPGTPDIVLPRHRVVVLVHGCFWHLHKGCRFSQIPQTNAAFWHAKLTKNALRDRRVSAALRRSGWHVLTVWECATRGNNSGIRLEKNLARKIGAFARAGRTPYAATTRIRG